MFIENQFEIMMDMDGYGLCDIIKSLGRYLLVFIYFIISYMIPRTLSSDLPVGYHHIFL